MGRFQRVENFRDFFLRLSDKWFWALLSLLTASGGVWLLLSMEQKDTFWFKLVLFVIVVAAVFLAIWISSIFLTNFCNKKLREYYTSGVPTDENTQEKTPRSSSRLLSLGAREQARIQLKRLRDASNFCFYGFGKSYMRVQWLHPASVPTGEPQEELRGWPKNNCIRYNHVTFPEFDEETQLWMVRRCERVKRKSGLFTFAEDIREVVEVFLTSTKVVTPNEEEARMADRTILVMGEPCVLTYKVILDSPNGQKKEENVALCAITWVGGRG